MREDIAEAWTTRLESGEEAQGRGLLRTYEEGQDRYCCLGVLCEIAVAQGVIEPAKLNSGMMDYTYGKDESRAALPIEVQEWAGMKARLGELGAKEIHHSLADANDYGMSFADIAQLIRAHKETL